MKRKLTFSEHLQDLIKKNAWSLREVQARTGISHSTIGQIANGEMEGIKLETIKAIVKGLKIAPIDAATMIFPEAFDFGSDPLAGKILFYYGNLPEDWRQNVVLILEVLWNKYQKIQTPSKVASLRLLGKVGAGGAIENFPEGHQREFDVPVELAKPNRYVLQVVGDSMTGVVNDGDYVVIEMGDVPVEGKVCVFRTENDGAVLKKWKRTRGKIELISTNPEYQMKIVSGDLKCEGWLVDVVKGNAKP